MADSEPEQVKGTLVSMRPLAMNFLQEKNDENSISGREERTSGTPTATCTSVTEGSSDSPHADASTEQPRVDPPTRAQGHQAQFTTPTQPPSYRVQFTPSTPEYYHSGRDDRVQDRLSPSQLSPSQQSPVGHMSTPEGDIEISDSPTGLQIYDDESSTLNDPTAHQTLSANSMRNYLDSSSQNSAVNCTQATELHVSAIRDDPTLHQTLSANTARHTLDSYSQSSHVDATAATLSAPLSSTGGSPVSQQTSTVRHGLDSPNQSSAVSTPIATPSAPPSTAQSVSSELGMSPYVVVKGGLVEVAQFESPGLLYARSTVERHNLDILRPADEVAEDVLGVIQGDTSRELSWTEDEEMPTDGQGFEKREGGQEAIRRKKPDVRKPHEADHHELDGSSSLESSDKVLPPLDPNVLRDLERQARKVASSLEYIMDNLHNSLHAMTVCTKQSVLLHRESVDNLHSVVDANVKATYSFLAKFEELKRYTVPLSALAQQIAEVNKTLKLLERTTYFH